jgi:hypothetical protein
MCVCGLVCASGSSWLAVAREELEEGFVESFVAWEPRGKKKGERSGLLAKGMRIRNLASAG